MQYATRYAQAESPRRLVLAAAALAAAIAIVWASASHAQSTPKAPSTAAPTMNQAVTPQAPGAVTQGSTMQNQAAPTEQKADAAKDKAKKAKDKAKDATKP
jgi:hypothetical protein